MIRVNPGEEILTANDPRHRNNNGGNGGGSISVSIENFKGGDSELADLKDMLLTLYSNNQLQDIF